jgi:four helix bundle protein
MARDYRQLEAFRVADQLVLDAYAATRDFPRDELFGLRSQIRRAALSGAANIVEGSAKSSDRDFVRFLEISLRSLRESAYELSIARRLGDIPIEASAAVEDRADHTARLVSRLIEAINRD